MGERGGRACCRYVPWRKGSPVRASGPAGQREEEDPMKRFLSFAAFAAFAVVAVSLSGTATAATFKGVVVAKDAKRKALVTSTARGLRTVRAKGQFSRIKVGQRVVVNARPMADGTFAARKVRPAGKTKRVRFKAVVVRSASARLIV